MQDPTTDCPNDPDGSHNYGADGLASECLNDCGRPNPVEHYCDEDGELHVD